MIKVILQCVRRTIGDKLPLITVLVRRLFNIIAAFLVYPYGIQEDNRGYEICDIRLKRRIYLIRNKLELKIQLIIIGLAFIVT